MCTASYHLPSPSPSVSWVLIRSTISGGLSVSSSALISACDPPGKCNNHPGSQENLVSNWEPAHSLVEDALSRAEIAPCLLALAVTYLPLCLWLGGGAVCSQLALLGIHSILCSVSGSGCTLEPFIGKFFFFFFFSLSGDPSLGRSLTLACSDCPQGIQSWSLP